MRFFKKKIFFLLIFIFLIITFSLFFLRHIILENIFEILKLRYPYIKNFNVSIGYFSRGFFSNLNLKDVTIYYSDVENLKIFHFSNLNLNFSISKIIKNIFLDHKIKKIEISLIEPTCYLNNIIKSNLFLKYSDISELLLKFTGKTSLNLSVIDGDFIIKEPSKSIVSNFNSYMVLDNDSFRFEELYFDLFKVNFKGYGYLERIFPSVDLVLNLESEVSETYFKAYGTLEELNVTVDNIFQNKKDSLIEAVLKFYDSELLIEYADINNKYQLNGTYNIKDKIGEFRIKGGHEKISYPFISFSDFEYDGVFDFKFDISKFPKIDLVLCIERLNTSYFNLMTNLYLKGEIGLKEKNIFKGRLYSEGSILNYYPFYEIDSEIILTDEKIIIEDFIMEDILNLRLDLGLSDSYMIDLQISSNSVKTNEILSNYYPEYYGFFSGLADFNIYIYGKLNNPQIQAILKAKNGNIRNLRYDDLNFKVKGHKNWMIFQDSFIKHQQEHYILLGGFNPKKFRSAGFLEDVEFVAGDNIFSWQGWTFSESSKGTVLGLQKNIGKDFRVSFSTYLMREEAESLYYDYREDEVELEYSLTEDKSLKLELKDQEERIGIQRSIKF